MNRNRVLVAAAVAAVTSTYLISDIPQPSE